MELLKKFIAFEGIDGSGKSTVMKRIASMSGGKFFFTAEPTEGFVGKLLREALRGEKTMDEKTMAYLFSADRAEHIYGKGGILERLSEGKTVLSDRYLFSSLAYQGEMAGRKLARKLNEDFPLPEALVFFRVDVKTALSRLALSGAAFELYEKENALRGVASAYEEEIKTYENAGGMVKRVDASKSAAEVTDEVLAFLLTLI